MKKLLAAALAVFCLVGSMSFALGTGDSGGGKNIEMTFFFPVNVGGAVTKFVDKICSDWNELHPEAIVKPVYTGNYDDTVVKIQTAVQGKNR